MRSQTRSFSCCHTCVTIIHWDPECSVTPLMLPPQYCCYKVLALSSKWPTFHWNVLARLWWRPFPFHIFPIGSLTQLFVNPALFFWARPLEAVLPGLEAMHPNEMKEDNNNKPRGPWRLESVFVTVIKRCSAFPLVTSAARGVAVLPTEERQPLYSTPFCACTFWSHILCKMLWTITLMETGLSPF